jgi:tRNA-specific 2-thiouridylase
MNSQVPQKSGRKKVYVGMSGGVDSSVSAALLKEQGFDVTGVFIKVWQPEWLADTNVCTWREDRLDAMRVAAQLGIPFITLDLEKEYKEEVVDYMIREYKAGRTPNPDVMCNRFVKFGGFYSWAMKHDADFVATGHYCQVIDGQLVMGDDANKDQTYFLWTLTAEQLKHVMFPVGNIEKPEVRKLAKKFGLATAEKKDSQGLCFIGKIDVKEFLGHYIDEKRGDVLDEDGKVIGYHDGAFFYTIGERHGFTVTVKTPNDAPYYVFAKDIEKNTISVSEKTAEGNLEGGKTRVELREANWVGDAPQAGKKYMARSRYRETLQEVTLSNGKWVEFTNPQFTLSPGQSIVVYEGNVCKGGGIIV